jgi:hypothetical protein
MMIELSPLVLENGLQYFFNVVYKYTAYAWLSIRYSWMSAVYVFFARDLSSLY